MTELIIATVIALAMGAMVVYLLMSRRVGDAIRQRDVVQARLDSLAEERRHEVERLEAEHERQLSLLHEQHLGQLDRQLTLVKEQLTTASEKVLAERQQQLTAANAEQLHTLLDPLRENLKTMRETVEKNDRNQSATIGLLNERIKENLRMSQEVGERADRLAAALTGENKTQGNFGELRLRQLLEDMGFKEGEQFEQQVTLRDSDGRAVRGSDSGSRLVPDVILHFPDKRDVIIDSKVSLTAFYDYHNAETDEQRTDALHRHVASVRAHVNELSAKNYSRYLRADRQTLDFVFMYVFSDSALQLALQQEPSLSREAYDKGVIIAGSQSLYMMLRVLEMSWKQMSQFENQKEIMNTASELVERVQIYYERVLKVEEQLRKTSDAFADLRRITRTEGRSIARSASKLVKCGARQSAKHVALPSADVIGDDSADIDKTLPDAAE